MIKLKLKKALSYAGIVSATKEKPYVTVEDKTTADAAVASGFFEVVDLDASEELPKSLATGTITKLDVMTVAQLKEYAKTNGIDLEGASKKEEILDRIEVAQAGPADDSPAGQFTGSNQGGGVSE